MRNPTLFRHFRLMEAIQSNYRCRADPRFLATAIEACENQIRMAPQAAEAFRLEYRGQRLPSHVGYKQLAIIREKEGNLKEALRICQQAQGQGWAGDWKKRIASLSKKVEGA